MPYLSTSAHGELLNEDGRYASLLGEPLRPEWATDEQWAAYLKAAQKLKKQKKKAKKKGLLAKIGGGVLAVGGGIGAIFTGGATLPLVGAGIGLMTAKGKKGKLPSFAELFPPPPPNQLAPLDTVVPGGFGINPAGLTLPGAPSGSGLGLAVGLGAVALLLVVLLTRGRR